jgi:serine kinase of HPr protein (carbohydrate metabolism regulator)
VAQLHAGAVEHAGCLVLLLGHAGNAKTLLTARLVAAGARYFSDEIVLVERGRGDIRSVPVSLCVKPKGVP